MSFGICGKDNTTTLIIPMDDMKINFTFKFEKRNISGSQFTFAMTEAQLEYSTDSKYFPNHDHIGKCKALSAWRDILKWVIVSMIKFAESGKVTLKNSSL